MRNEDPLARDCAAYSEFSISFVLLALHTATGADFSPLRIAIMPGSKTRFDVLSDLWGCPVVEATETHEIVFGEDQLELGLLSFDGPLLRHLSQFGEILLNERRERLPDLQITIEKAIERRLATGLPAAPDIAAELGMSQRTLSRRLDGLGLGFRSMVEDVRRRKGELLLEDPSMSLAEISFLLGYSDQSSFTNAFRRWTGSTPGAFRQKRMG